MPIKLIATDLDGTLMAPDHMTITERTKKALFSAHEKGVKIAIATGRTIKVTEPVTAQVPFVDYIIYSNGAGVYDRKENRNIYSNMMSWDTVCEIMDFLDERPVFYEVSANGHSNVRQDREEYLDIKDIPKEFIDEWRKATSIFDELKPELPKTNIEKINLYGIPEICKNEVYDFLFGIDGICLTSALADDIEITVTGADKGNALFGMCKNLGITPNEVMTFGDANNDISMLRFASMSFAMANAKDEVKREAKYVTLSNAEDGLARAVEKYVLD